jgi:alpha-tubulin suppressor-like RCC1 family protein
VGPGDGHTCLVRSDGAMFCSGRNSQRQLGPASTNLQERVLLRIGTDSDWVQVVSGQQYSCGLRADRSLWCWGTNTAFQSEEGSPLGIQANEAIDPTRVPGGDWLAIAAHTFHTCAIARDAEVWCWGRNHEGQLSSDDLSLRVGPFRIGRRATSVAVGVFTTCLVDSAGVVACTGKNERGELGTGDLERRSALTDVPLVASE